MTQLNSRFAKGLYGITPEWEDKNRLLTAIEEACRGGMQILQWRQKNLSLSDALPLALKAKEICHQYNCQFFINDSVQLALDCKADGIHIGRDDGSVAELRKACAEQGQNLLIGVSCYNDIELAKEAINDRVDYLAFGALFSSSVKPDAVSAPLTLFAEIKAYMQELGLSVDTTPALVGIGGIDQSNAASAIEAGADSLAVISGLFEADDIQATAQYLNNLF
ncbi:Thiamine-phosphate synthase [Oligella ureolytica]|uniref:thiamine phosphate synthase n=1 Tax=Oligella ureolytica TaxID=90244 RepID=UPI000E070C6E|nr:thiamine phosphate synthase [Oligella ureolytica]SUA57478.1 Thiamine-phosphate synthase [Oligella ureolytica]